MTKVYAAHDGKQMKGPSRSPVGADELKLFWVEKYIYKK